MSQAPNYHPGTHTNHTGPALVEALGGYTLTVPVEPVVTVWAYPWGATVALGDVGEQPISPCQAGR